MDSRETRAPKFKRCKISRQQLTVLMQNFEDDPLPSFEKRQTIATRLGMTPRSVQIWFQNRRQRLLKPLRQGDSGELDLTYDGAREGSFTTNSDCGDCITSMEENGSYMMDDHDQQHHSPGSSPSTIFKQFSSDSSAGSTGSTASPSSGLHPLQGLNLPAMAQQQQQADGSSSQPNLLMMFQKALVDRQLPPGVAVLLAQALQTQISGSVPSASDPQRPSQQHAPQQQPFCYSREASTSQSSDSSALQHSTPSIARRASPPTEGVDGLLLLSACADAQRPAAPTPSPSVPVQMPPIPAPSPSMPGPAQSMSTHAKHADTAATSQSMIYAIQRFMYTNAENSNCMKKGLQNRAMGFADAFY